MANILVIDDEESLRFTFEDFLIKEGHTVFTARNFREALETISGHLLDVIFSDIVLGGKSGIDILRQVKERKLHCPMVMITGYPNIETASEALRLGAFDYITKPVQREDLLRVTNLALLHKEMVEERERCSHNLEAIFRSVQDAIITVDKDLVVLAANEAAAGLCGLGAGAVGKKIETRPLSCQGKCLGPLKEAVEEKRFVQVARLECSHRERPNQVVNLSVFPLIDRGGGFSGAVMAVRDETRLVTLEEDLKERRGFHNIVGASRRMQDVYSLVECLADVETSVLITGESGTGKELVAGALHYSGARRDKPFVMVNCAALSENLLESELFGHVKGAFTGAVKDKEGRFRKADGGTIFLDEIGSISAKMQSNLLRVLQEKEFERVGDSNSTKVDVRVIAATNRDLRDLVQRGEFREDLYYRLKVVEIHLPLLREREEDIPLLVDHFLQKLAAKFNREPLTVSDDVMRLFMEYPWPGNVRELQHALEHAVVLCRRHTITLDNLPADLRDFAAAAIGKVAECQNNESGDHDLLLRALRQVAGNRAQAARLLGMSERTVFRKIKKYDISEDDILEKS